MDETTDTGYTASELLVEVDRAIQTILKGGQSYQLGSWTITRASLAQLRKMRQELQAQLTSDSGALFPNTSVAVFDGR